MRRRPNWKSPKFDKAFQQLDRAGFAWEFLRRNPSYQEEYETIDDRDALAEVVGQRWGLPFRV